MKRYFMNFTKQSDWKFEKSEESSGKNEVNDLEGLLYQVVDFQGHKISLKAAI